MASREKPACVVSCPDISGFRLAPGDTPALRHMGYCGMGPVERRRHGRDHQAYPQRQACREIRNSRVRLYGRTRRQGRAASIASGGRIRRADLLSYIGEDAKRGACSIRRAAWLRPMTIVSGVLPVPGRNLNRTFGEDGGYDDFVLIRDITFNSHCEHHMMPRRQGA